MSEPKYHHYVPRFYLSRFTNSKGKIWVYDKQTDKTFRSAPDSIGGQRQFYRSDELAAYNIDPLEMEKQFADLEYQVSNITNNWFLQFLYADKLIIPEINRDLVSTFIATQLLRTVEARETLVQFASAVKKDYDSAKDAQNLHIALLWDDALVNDMAKRISDCIWLFGNNTSATPFCTSDHPVLVKSYDNKRWLFGPRIFDDGMYIVYPLSQTLIMYCKDPKYWDLTRQFENSITPVEFTDYMVKHENSGQIGMSYRFVFSNNSDFNFANEFLMDNKEQKNPLRKRFGR